MYRFSLCSLLTFFLFTQCNSGATAQDGLGKQPVKIIYDTDIDLDVDDVGALAVLHALADKGEAEILGVVVNAPTPYGATTVAAINRYYGRPAIPVGDMPVEEYVYDRSFDEYYRNYSVTTPYGNFNVPIFRRFDHGIKSRKDVWNGVQLYRKLLAEAPDQSVTIVAVGLLTVLEDLLQSGPDQYSKLTGKNLIRRKVKDLVCMAGGNAPAPKRASFNWGFEGRGDAERISRDWPTPIFLSPLGGRVGTGARLSTETPEFNPVRVAYELFLKPANHKNRPSWDQIAAYYAVRRAGDIFEEPPGRRLEVTAEKVNHSWRDGQYEWREAKPGEPLHVKIGQKISNEALGKIIEDLMVQLPKNNPELAKSNFTPQPVTGDNGAVFTVNGLAPRSISVALNEEPVKLENLLVLTTQETLNWSLPGSKGAEVVVISPGQTFLDEYKKVLQSEKPTLILVDWKHQEAFRQLKESSSKTAHAEANIPKASYVFVLTHQDKAPWYSVNLQMR